MSPIMLLLYLSKFASSEMSNFHCLKLTFFSFKLPGNQYSYGLIHNPEYLSLCRMSTGNCPKYWLLTPAKAFNLYSMTRCLVQENFSAFETTVMKVTGLFIQV